MLSIYWITKTRYPSKNVHQVAQDNLTITVICKRHRAPMWIIAVLFSMFWWRVTNWRVWMGLAVSWCLQSWNQGNPSHGHDSLELPCITMALHALSFVMTPASFLRQQLWKNTWFNDVCSNYIIRFMSNRDGVCCTDTEYSGTQRTHGVANLHDKHLHASCFMVCHLWKP